MICTPFRAASAIISTCFSTMAFFMASMEILADSTFEAWISPHLTILGMKLRLLSISNRAKLPPHFPADPPSALVNPFFVEARFSVLDDELPADHNAAHRS